MQSALLQRLQSAEDRCRLGKERVWLYRIVLPNEESAKVIDQADGNVRAIRVIDDEVYNKWKRLRFEFYMEIKKLAISVERGLRLVQDEYRDVLEAYLQDVKRRLEEIEAEIWKRMPPNLAERLVDRESLYPGKNFRWIAIPIEICREDFNALVKLLEQ